MATVCKDVVTVTTPGDCVDVLVTFVAHLDGSGATTFLIVVPAFLPIIGDHIKYSLKFVWPMSILTLIASTLLGVISF